MLRLYVIWSLIYLPLVLYRNDISEVGIVYYSLRFARNFFLRAIQDHLWYLNAIFLDLLIIYILLKFKVRVKTILVCSFILYLIGVASQSYYGLFSFLYDYKLLASLFDFLSLFFPTTRNFLFFGLFFTSLGFYLSYAKIDIPLSSAIKGFAISMALLFIEVFILEYNDLIKAHDMYLMLIPSCLFLFYIGLNLPLESRPYYRNLRVYGNCIYFSHVMANAILRLVLPVLCTNSLSRYFSIVALSLLGSVIVYWLSKKKGFTWLRYVYS